MTRNTDANAGAIIADLACRANVALTPSGSEIAALLLRSQGNWDAGPITARNAAGDEITAEEWFQATIAANPSYVATPQKAVPPATGIRTADALAKTQAARAGQAEAKAAQARQLFEMHGNPWASSHLNRTRQALIRSGDPVLADKLMAEAAL